MNPIQLFLPNHTQLEEEEAERLQKPHTQPYTVEARPPRQKDLPGALEEFIRGIHEFQTKWLGLRNISPGIVYEIRRTGSQLQFQYSAPNKRVERKIRTHLNQEIPGIQLVDGTNGLPVSEEMSIGGGLLTPGRGPWYPLKTGHASPPINSLASTLHHHAMQDTTVVVQILLQPVTGRPVRNWLWRKQARLEARNLRKEKEKLWGSVKPSKREKKKADLIEQKVDNTRFHTTIRFLIAGAGEYTASRVKELAGAFNAYESLETDQYLNASTIRSLRRSQFLNFAKAVADRQPRAWTSGLHTTLREAAALVTLPDHTQENIQYAQPQQ